MHGHINHPFPQTCLFKFQVQPSVKLNTNALASRALVVPSSCPCSLESVLLCFYGSFFAATGQPIGIKCLWQKLFDAFKALSKFLTYSVFSVLHIRRVSSPSAMYTYSELLVTTLQLNLPNTWLARSTYRATFSV